MKRRNFIVGLGALFAWPLVKRAEAQPVGEAPLSPQKRGRTLVMVVRTPEGTTYDLVKAAEFASAYGPSEDFDAILGRRALAHTCSIVVHAAGRVDLKDPAVRVVKHRWAHFARADRPLMSAVLSAAGGVWPGDLIETKQTKFGAYSVYACSIVLPKPETPT